VSSAGRLQGLKSNQRFVVGAVWVAAVFMNLMDSTIVNVALPTLGHQFSAGTADVQWVVLGYLLSLAVFIPASGWFGDRFGQKRIFLLALALFTGASMACGTAVNLPMLVVCRILQGVGGGMLTPVGMAMLYRTYPPEDRARVSRILVLPTVVAPTAGPILGGLFVTHASWRWIFFMNLPIGVATLLFGWFFLHEHRQSTPGRFDRWGFALSGGGLALFLYGLSEGPSRGWTSVSVLGAGVVGIAMLAATVVVELRISEPMLHLRLFQNRMFEQANVALGLAAAAFIGVLFAAPLFLQEAHGLSALGSGLSTFPEALGVMSAVQVSSRIYPVIGPRRIAVGGLLICVAATLWLSSMGATTDLWWIRLAIYLVGLGVGFSFMSMQTAAFSTITRADMGRASALFNTQRQSAGAFGVAVLATVLTSQVHHGIPTLGSFHKAYLVAAALAAVGCIAALRLHDSDAASTMAGGRAARLQAALGDQAAGAEPVSPGSASPGVASPASASPASASPGLASPASGNSALLGPD
jgi:EmrB/QacA subfamily drug resistance transporter